MGYKVQERKILSIRGLKNPVLFGWSDFYALSDFFLRKWVYRESELMGLLNEQQFLEEEKKLANEMQNIERFQIVDNYGIIVDKDDIHECLKKEINNLITKTLTDKKYCQHWITYISRNPKGRYIETAKDMRRQCEGAPPSQSYNVYLCHCEYDDTSKLAKVNDLQKRLEKEGFEVRITQRQGSAQDQSEWLKGIRENVGWCNLMVLCASTTWCNNLYPDPKHPKQQMIKTAYDAAQGVLKHIIILKMENLTLECIEDRPFTDYTGLLDTPALEQAFDALHRVLRESPRTG